MATESALTEVHRHRDTLALELAWADGFRARLPYDTLRGFCPCAGCQGHWAEEVSYHAPASGVEALTIEPVGNYAISIQWSDGHATGIYRFDFLRQLATREQEERP